AGTGRLAGHVERARGRMEPAADRPDGESPPGAGRRAARPHAPGYRERRADGDHQLVVDRRLAQQVPVRLRARAPNRERHARRRGEEFQLSRHQREFLAQPLARGQYRHTAGARHSALRQGRAVAGDPRWTRIACVRIHKRGGLGRRALMPPREQADRQSTMEAYFHELAALLDGLIEPGETYTASLSAETSDFVRMNRAKVRT